MLTARERERCRELAAALDRGDADAYRRAEPSLTPEMKGEVWDQRAHVKAMAARAAQGRQKPAAAQPARTLDLDYWSDSEPVEPDDGGGDTDQTTKLCDNCRGLGRTADGSQCERCGGSGRVPLDDVDDDEEDDDGSDSKTKKREQARARALPPDLQAAIGEADAVLAKYDKLSLIWKETSRAIPADLREEQRLYVAADSGAHLAAVRTRRLDAARRRAAASEGLVDAGPTGWLEARDGVRGAQAAFAKSVVAEFHQRWQLACTELVRLHAEAAQLSGILRVSVATSSPFTAAINVITQRPEVHWAGARVAPPETPAALTGLIDVLDRLDSASGLAGALKQGREARNRRALHTWRGSGRAMQARDRWHLRGCTDLLCRTAANISPEC